VLDRAEGVATKAGVDIVVELVVRAASTFTTTGSRSSPAWANPLTLGAHVGQSTI